MAQAGRKYSLWSLLHFWHYGTPQGTFFCSTAHCPRSWGISELLRSQPRIDLYGCLLKAQRTVIGDLWWVSCEWCSVGTSKPRNEVLQIDCIALYIETSIRTCVFLGYLNRTSLLCCYHGRLIDCSWMLTQSALRSSSHQVHVSSTCHEMSCRVFSILIAQIISKQ